MERIILEGGFGNGARAVAVKAGAGRRGAGCDAEVSVCKCGGDRLVSTRRGTASRRKDAGRACCACLRLVARGGAWPHGGQRAGLEAAVRQVLGSKLALG